MAINEQWSSTTHGAYNTLFFIYIIDRIFHVLHFLVHLNLYKNSREYNWHRARKAAYHCLTHSPEKFGTDCRTTHCIYPEHSPYRRIASKLKICSITAELNCDGNSSTTNVDTSPSLRVPRTTKRHPYMWRIMKYSCCLEERYWAREKLQAFTFSTLNTMKSFI